MLLRCGVIAALTALSLLADDIALARIGGVWRYLPGLSEASVPVHAWREPGYDDHLWLAGRSGFSAGYAAPEATELPVLPVEYVSTYFRHTFHLSDPAQVKWLTLRVDYSDGFVAYLNGQEIARRNLAGLPGTLIPFSQMATNYHSRGEPEEIDVTPAARALVSGLNTLAVQLHGARPSSAGLCFAAELMANFNRAPYLQNMSSNQVQIIWKTPVQSDTRVVFGSGGLLDRAFHDPTLATTHVATLTNLAPDTVYQYQVSSAAGEDMAASPRSTFRTFRPSGPVRFMAFGDGGWNSLPQYQLAEVMRQARPDLVLETGDIVYPAFTSALADPRCFSVFQPHMASAPYFFAMGNHDLLAGAGHYLEAFYLPTNSVPMAQHLAAGTSPEHYYSFDHGDVHFTVLFVPFIMQHRVTVGDPQYNWLTNDLATTRQPWKIVTFHVPMNTSSAHRFDDFNYNGIYDRLEIRDVLLPVFSRYGVQLVLTGHEHGYERFNPANGVHSITTAGGGVRLYGFSALDEANALFWARYNCLQVSIDGDTLEALAFGSDGEVFDRMTIQRRLPAPKVYPAAWHSPRIETGPADDGDGNIYGQVFDFEGEAIPTLSGAFSNLGRVRVNNDQTNLYIGLEQVMIYSDNSIFLFLESPHLAGVTNLAAIGNGLLDPRGEGADGLDFLANLSFADFAPSLGCILGDEFADGQFRNFGRRGLSLNCGQGVFRLQPGLSDVAGIQLQQYHLSPQVGGARDEENAGYIELAVPLAELGGVGPGDTVRIGAVVGGGEYDLARRTRFLDTGFLGRQLIGSGLDAVILTGLEVRLAFDPADEDADGLTRDEELRIGTDPANPDSDGDGLPDGWEVAHQLDPLSASDSGADPDADGASNAAEFAAGTDPRDPHSVLRIQCELRGGQTLRISWKTVPGRRYQLQWSDSPVTEFQDLPGNPFSTSAVSTNKVLALDLDLPPKSARFYRVRLVSTR